MIFAELDQRISIVQWVSVVCVNVWMLWMSWITWFQSEYYHKSEELSIPWRMISKLSVWGPNIVNILNIVDVVNIVDIS